MQCPRVNWTKTLVIKGAAHLVLFNLISIPMYLRRALSAPFAGIENAIVMH